MSLQLRRHPRCPYGVMTVLLRLVPLAALLLLLLLVAIPTQAFLPPQARPPRLSSTFLHPRWPPSPCRVHSTKRSSQKQQQQQQQQDTPPQPKEIKGNALKDLERRLKGHSGDDKNPVPFAYVTQTSEGKQRVLLPPGPNQFLIVFSIIMALALGALGQLVGHFVNVPPFATLSLQPSQFAFGAFLALPLFGIDAVLQGVQEDTASEVYALSIFGTKTPVPLVLLLAAVVTLATSIGEEALFRGLIQQGLAKVLGPWLGLGLAAAVFGLAHKMGPSDVGFITLSGAYMGLVFLMFGDLTIPVALHASYDFLILCGAYLRAKNRMGGPTGMVMLQGEEGEEKGKKEKQV